MIYLYITLGCVLLLLAGYIFLLFWQAKTDVDKAPKEAMVDCHSGKHGAYPKKYAIVSHDYGTEEPVLICPFCYEEACKQALTNEGLKKNSQTQI